jgi:hypothetical protein
MSGDDEDRGEPLYIETKSFVRKSRGVRPEVLCIAMDLICLVWWPTKTAFAFDEEALAARFAADLPARGYTPDMLRQNRKKVASFFTVLPDGRWVPSPKYFSLTDGNAERGLY